MRETCSLPTAPLRARNRHPSVPHSPTSFPHPVYVIPAPTHVIPAKAGICAPVRDNGVPFPFPIAARSKSRHQTHRRRKSTQCDRMQQSTTKTRARACAHARARHSRHGGRRWVVRRPRARGVPPRPSRTPPRHSRTLSTSFPHPPTSFPRRRESACPRETTAFRLLSQSPRGARADTKPAVDGNRHNATEFYEPQRKLVPARAREAFPTWCTTLGRSKTARERRPSTSFPHPPTSFPRRRESLRPP